MSKILLERPEKLDYLVRARPAAYELGFDQLGNALTALAEQLEEKP